MSISSTNRKAGPFTGNGTASSFPFYFKVFEATDLQVVLLDIATNLETTLTITANYTVSLNANQDATPGGTVTLTAGALASGYKLTITSNIGNLQPTNLTNQGGFYPDVVEDALDRATIQIQQMAEQLDRAVTIPISSIASTALPYPQGGTVIGWDDTGSSLVNLSPEDIASQQLYANWKYDTFTGDGTTTQFTLQSNPGNIANMDVSVSGVTQLPGTDYTLSGTTIAFTTAPALGLPILVRYGQATVQTNVTYSQEVFNVTSGTVDGTGKQTIFNLTSSYSPGNNGISVYLNGSRLVGGTDYTETTSTRITLSKGAYPGDVVLIITAEPINANVSDAAQVSYTPAGANAVATNVQAKLRETVSVKDFGAVGDGVTDDTAAFNKAITAVALLGGGQVTAPPATYKIIGTIILVTNIKLYLPGVTLSGNGSNTIFETGTLVGSTTVSNIYTYAPPLGFSVSNFCYNTVLDGVTTTNCYIGARLQRFNDGCEIRNCFFSASYRAILSTNGWNQRFVLNKFYQTVQLNDYVDWTVVESNAFESITSNAGLLIGQNQLGQQLVSITQGSNSTAYGLATISSGGAVTAIAIFNGGSGYTAGAVTVAAYYGTGPGSGTTGTVTVSAGAVTAFTVVSGGSSYTPPEPTYGGSWTCRISSNGFHYCGVGIMTQVQVEGLQIIGNHFESSKRHIWQNSDETCKRWKVHNNHLAAQVTNVTAFEMYALSDSDIRFNDFVVSGGGSFTKYVVLNSTNTYGNKIQYPYDGTPTSGEPDRSMYSLADTNLLEYMAGSNNPALTIPVLENYSGANGYTFEKYRSIYPAVNNSIPFCTLSNNGSGTYYVDTFVNCSAYGVDQPVLFSIQIGGATTYECMGFVGRFDVLTIVNKEYYSGGAGLTITASNNSGKLRLTFAGASATANVTGFVKAL